MSDESDVACPCSKNFVETLPIGPASSYLQSIFFHHSMTFTDIETIVSEKSLLKHMFYQAWSRGELTKGQLAIYAKEYFHLVKNIPGIVARVQAVLSDDALKASLDHNRIEEQEHVELWKRFALSLGVSEQELLNHVPSQVCIKAVADLEALAEQSVEEGVAAMYALECELPAIARTKMDGLKEFYGLTSEDAQIYFEEHLKEEKHLQEWRKFPLGAKSRAAAEQSIAAQNRALDAVCMSAGISLVC